MNKMGDFAVENWAKDNKAVFNETIDKNEFATQKPGEKKK